jgi:hypothetical protein
VSIVWTGVTEFVAALDRASARASSAARSATVEIASEIEKATKERASGRPGPEVVTGTLRRSIRHDPVTPWGVGGWQTQIGPTAVYGRRIELGFAGPDSLGRHFDPSKKYPYFEPGFRSVVPRIPAIMAKNFRYAVMG